MSDAQLEMREFRATINPDDGTIEGIAVPYGQTADIGGEYREQFDPGSVEPNPNGGAKLYFGHQAIIGHVVASEERAEGFHIKAKIADTALGRDALALARSGALDSFSVGFKPVAQRMEDGVLHRTKVQLQEVSLVERPAYAGAKVSVVRSEQDPTNPITESEPTVPETDTITRADLDTLGDDLERRMTVAIAAVKTPEPQVIDHRSAGEVLKALATGDDTEVRNYEETLKRAYAGGTSADTTNNPGWIGDLSRIYDDSSGVLAAIFETAPAPTEGDVVSYTVISSNTLEVDAHTEGADLTPGKITFTPGNANILTYAGLAQLTLREIERSSVQVLDKTIQGLTIAAAQREKAVLRTAFGAAITAQTTAGHEVAIAHALAASTVADWTGAIVDAAVKFDAVALALTGLVVDASIYKYLAQLEDGNGRLVFDSSGNSNGSVGTLSLPSLSGNLAGVRVVLDPGASAGVASFVNSSAITRYLTPLVQLTQTNVVNLSQGTAVYRYGVPIATVPEGIVPLTFTAP
jgi:HK97 family phage prohead protease/HK97 family phage major capsid protein